MKLPAASPTFVTPLAGDHPTCRHYEACRRIARYYGTDEWRGCRADCLSRQEMENDE